MAEGDNTVTNSERRTLGCKHLWFLRYGLCLSHPQGEAALVAMYHGTLWHKLMEIYHSAPDSDSGMAQAKAWAAHFRSNANKPLFLPDTAPSPQMAIVLSMVSEEMLQRYDEHWKGSRWSVIFTERRLIAQVRHPATRKRTEVARFAGKPDMLVTVDESGDAWLVEHKMTTTDLDKWLLTRSYDPQAATYAWLVWEQMKIRCKGIIYNLANRKMPSPWTSFEVTKDRTRLKKPTGLPQTTSEIFLEAIAENGFQLSDQEWYAEVAEQLQRRENDGYWFKRSFHLFHPEEIRRAERELYSVATSTVEMVEATSELRELISNENDDSLPTTIAAVVKQYGDNFPRNPSYCYIRNTPCAFMNFCKEQSPEAAQSFIVRPHRHVELEQDLSEEP